MVQVKEHKNLCYTTTYWNMKDSTLPGKVLNY